MQPLLLDAELYYLYDGTLEGMFTAIFQAFTMRQYPENIVTEEGLQLSLLGSYVPVHTDLDRAARVRDSIITRLGTRLYYDISVVFLSDDERKGGVILRYLQYMLKAGRRARLHLAHPAVNAFEELHRVVAQEAHYMRQFVRFAHTESGVYYSKINPKACIVPLVMDHFAARFNVQPFMLYDANHQMAGVFDTQTWWLVDTTEQELTPPAHSKIEDTFQALWQTFFDTIAIEERRNPTCQRNFMPKRFWGNMCEQIPPEMRTQRPMTETPTAAAKRLASTEHRVPLLTS